MQFDPESIMRQIMQSMSGGKKDDRETVKVIIGKPEYKQIFEENVKIGEQIISLTEKMDFLKRKFWTRVEEDLDYYGDMHYNSDLNAIEILESSSDYAKRIAAKKGKMETYKDEEG